MNAPERYDSDIAVIEQIFGEEWRPIAYIGPGRISTFISVYELHAGGSIHIRYFHKVLTPPTQQ